MSTELIYDGRPQKRKFIRENLKIGFRKPRSRKPLIMGNIEAGVSHFLCTEHNVWQPINDTLKPSKIKGMPGLSWLKNGNKE
jgi:hypothetical protein